VIVNLIAFATFWLYPLAPPRMSPGLGYTDVIAQAHALISWHSGALVHNADQLASMPSLHVAWATWSGLALWQAHPRPAIAPLTIAYPLLTATVVIATGNHYLLDTLAGAAAALIALAAQRALKHAQTALAHHATAGSPWREHLPDETAADRDLLTAAP
jgi:diacylglycerol O-acyltransferase / wax synthase